MYPFKKKKAFTLPELIVSISISSIVMLLVMQIYIYTSTATRRYFNEHELFENARIAMNFMETQVRAADAIALTTNHNTLNYLDLYVDDKMMHSFRYYYSTTDGFYMRLGFGNQNTHQELAKDLKNIQVSIDHEHHLLNIEIETNSFTKEDPKMILKPISMKRQISLAGKSIQKKNLR